MNTEQLYTATELCTATGLTYRQLNYWTVVGAIEPTLNAAGSGIGHHRRYHPNLVEPLRAVAALHRALGAGIPTDLVALIVDNYHAGHVDIGGGLLLSWRAPRPLEWSGPRYLTDAECDRLLEELETVDPDVLPEPTDPTQ